MIGNCESGLKGVDARTLNDSVPGFRALIFIPSSYLMHGLQTQSLTKANMGLSKRDSWVEESRGWGWGRSSLKSEAI